MPLISICIPAYKNIEFLQRLLQSIGIQTFKDFEVIISDDSPDDSIKSLLENYNTFSHLSYYKNEPSLGTPANWNFAISKAKGEWIKLMHDDDWFADKNSLKEFANTANKIKDVSLIFSSYFEIDVSSNKKQLYQISKAEESLLRISAYNIFKKNFIGPPSVTLIKNNQFNWYNEKLKWVVDFEFYMRVLQKQNGFFVIRKPLINIGVNSFQVTKQAFRNPEIEVPENLYLLNANPILLKNIFAYDYYWRFLRNLSIRKIEDLYFNDQPALIPDSLKSMLSFQQKIPVALLKNGIISKALMTLSYISNSKKS